MITQVKILQSGLIPINYFFIMFKWCVSYKSIIRAMTQNVKHRKDSFLIADYKSKTAQGQALITVTSQT